MTSRSCALATSNPPAAAISTTATYSPTCRVKFGIDQEQKRERGEHQDPDLRNRAPPPVCQNQRFLYVESESSSVR